MKRTVPLILCLVTVAVGIWVLRGAQTLASACTLSASVRGGTGCVTAVPFLLLGIALCAAGAVSMIVVLSRSVRSLRTRRKQSAVSTLHVHEVESLRDVA
jgi:hypothetical protein